MSDRRFEFGWHVPQGALFRASRGQNVCEVSGAWWCDMVSPTEGAPTKTDPQLVQVDLSTPGTLFLPSKCHWPAPGFLSVLLQATSDHDALLDIQTQRPSSVHLAHARCWGDTDVYPPGLHPFQNCSQWVCLLPMFAFSESHGYLFPSYLFYSHIWRQTIMSRTEEPGVLLSMGSQKELDTTQILNNHHIGKLLGGSFL